MSHHVTRHNRLVFCDAAVDRKPSDTLTRRETRKKAQRTERSKERQAKEGKAEKKAPQQKRNRTPLGKATHPMVAETSDIKDGKC